MTRRLSRRGLLIIAVGAGAVVVLAALLIAITTAGSTRKVTLRGVYLLEGSSVIGPSTNCHGTGAYNYARPGLIVTIADATGHVVGVTVLKSTGDDNALSEWAQRYVAVDSTDTAKTWIDELHHEDANGAPWVSCPMLFTVAVPKRPLYKVTIDPAAAALDYHFTDVQKEKMVVGFIAGSYNSNGSPPAATVSPPSTTPVTAPPSTNTLPAGIVPLVKLLPDDVLAASGCSAFSPPVPLTGMVTDLSCTGDRGLPGSMIFGYQFDGRADYVAGLAAFNRAKGFDPATATPNCPAPAGATGQVTWNNQLYPTRNDQIIECFTLVDNTLGYLWTIPTQLAFVEAESGPTTTFSQLDTWWTDHAGPFN
jgi:hypothetical protein